MTGTRTPRLPLLLLAAATGCGLLSESPSPPACVSVPAGAQPLLVGDTVRLRAGTLYNSSDCIAPPPHSVVWASEHPAVASVDSAGLVRGVTPGRFTAIGIADTDTLRAEGFVLPPGWTARVIPDSVTARVGDSVAFVVVALDSLGQRLPMVPYWLYTPEWRSRGVFDSTGAVVPPRVTKEWAFQGVSLPSVFHLERAGSTSLIGEIGEQRVTAKLVVLPAEAPRE